MGMKLNSRKLVFIVIGVLLTVANDKFKLGLSMETMTLICGSIAAYVIGQGIADHGNQGKAQDVVAPGDDGPNWEDTSDVSEDEKKDLFG